MTAIFWQALCFCFSYRYQPHFSSILLAPLFYLSDHPSLPFSSFVFFFCFDCLLPFISSHEKLLPGLKGSTRKDPSARLVFSWECIQRVALFCSAHYHIYPTPDSLYCRSQDLFFQICCKAVWSFNSIPCWTPTTIPLTDSPKPFTIYLLSVRQIFMNTGYVYSTVYHSWCIQ